MTRKILLPDRVFDSVNGDMLEGHAVVIAGDRVTEVTDQIPDDVTRLEGTSVVPGLIDVHTHLAVPLDDGQGFAQVVQRNQAEDALLGVKHAAQTIKAGFTTVRDAGCWRAFTDVALRDSIDTGIVVGPRMMVAGAFMGCPGGGGDITGLALDVDTVLPRDFRVGISSGVDEYRANARQILRCSTHSWNQPWCAGGDRGRVARNSGNGQRSRHPRGRARPRGRRNQESGESWSAIHRTRLAPR